MMQAADKHLNQAPFLISGVAFQVWQLEVDGKLL
jgi:hypothetical protein